jgi:hypothetical protein
MHDDHPYENGPAPGNLQRLKMNDDRPYDTAQPPPKAPMVDDKPYDRAN